MTRNKTTKEWSNFWRLRKIDWKVSYLDTADHPHRHLISEILSTIRWDSLLEVGCGSGANLVNIISHFKNKQVGGIDINADAIELARETFEGAFLKVGSVEDIMMSDNSVDVILSDMCMIYIDKPDRAIKEIKRVSRNYVLFSELHSESLFMRMKLKWTSGYNAHNYRKLLEKHGFTDIIISKIPLKAWEGGNPQKDYGYFVRAKTPKRK